jgi:gas vesicle protein
MGNQKTCSVTGYVLSFLIGAVVGGGISLLIAPQSGDRTRKQWKRMAGDMKENVEDYYDEMKDKTIEATKKVQDLYRETKRTVESKLDAAKKDFSK